MKLNPTRVLSVIGAALVLVIGGAVAYAQIPSADGTITACYTKPTSALRVINADRTTCRRGETALTWNQRGAPGISGYEKVVSTRTFSPGTGAAGGVNQQADCPPGKVATGGGGTFVDADGSPNTFNVNIVNASFPTADSTGWVIVLSGTNFDVTGVTGIEAYVLCAEATR